MTLQQVGAGAAIVGLVAIFYFGHRAHTPVAPVPGKVVASPNPNVVYHRVEQGGKEGDAISCAAVQPFVDGKSPAELANVAKQYGVSPAEVSRWYICK